jgi:MFS family permease
LFPSRLTAGFWTIGTWVQASLAFALLNDMGWRKLVLVSTAPYVVLLLLLPLVPESPRFLLVKGRVDAAQQVLSKVMRVCRRNMPEGSLQPLLSDEDAADSAGLQDREADKGEWCGVGGVGAAFWLQAAAVEDWLDCAAF